MIIVLDTETSGLPQQPNACVLSIGAVCLNEGVEVASFYTEVRPVFPIGEWSAKAMEINKLDPKRLERAPDASMVWATLLGWMSLHTPVEAVLSYNRSFDEEMMRRSFQSSEHLPWGPCLMIAAARHVSGNPKRKRLALKKACPALGVVIPGGEQDHNALADARLAAGVYNKLVEAGGWK